MADREPTPTEEDLDRLAEALVALLLSAYRAKQGAAAAGAPKKERGRAA